MRRCRRSSRSNVDPQTIKAIRAGAPGRARAEGIIRSPIAGTVVEKLITPGELLQAGTTPCFTVADLSRVWVMAQVFGSDIAVGQRRAIRPKCMTGVGATRLSGTVDNIAAVVDPEHALGGRARGGRQSRRVSARSRCMCAC